MKTKVPTARPLRSLLAAAFAFSLPSLFVFCSIFAHTGISMATETQAKRPSVSTTTANPPSPGATKTATAVSDGVAAEMEIAAFGNALTNSLQDISKKSARMENVVQRHEGVLLLSASSLVALYLIVRFGRRITTSVGSTSLKPWLPASAGASATMDPQRSDDEKCFAEFAAAFRVGPGTTSTPAPPPVSGFQPSTEATQPKPDSSRRNCSPEEFLASASDRILTMRSLLQEVNTVSGELARGKILAELTTEVETFKAEASDPGLRPVWQVTSSLDGLIRQLRDRPTNITPSTLRTVAGSVDLLSALCSLGPRPDLLTDPPVRFLAVDDDPISRHTVSFALRRALNAPDLAENGQSGLVLATENAYDVIFLDVQMPEMDGFELCKKIREGASNQNTPVVFVTCQSDFNSRAQSSLVGGCDLIGKPFLTFEITAKALMLALRKRLDKLKPATLAN